MPLDPQREPLPTRVEDTPQLPAAYDVAIERGLARLAVAPSDGARVAIDGHVRLLLAWTGAINLTAVRDPVAVATLHVVDSLAALATLRARSVTHLLDLGSGGGFPGIPLAAALPVERALLVDSVAKKVRFLETVAEATGLAGRVEAVATRAERLATEPRGREQWQAVTARAVAGLGELAELAFPLLRPGGVLVAWKRGELRGELAGLGRALPALGGGTVESIDAGLGGLLPGHQLVVVAKSGPTPPGFPRDPAMRKRRPW